MKEQEIKYIEKLMNCFFEGTTTNAEEKTLYIFFKSDGVPEHLMKYKPVFEYFGDEIVDELQNLETDFIIAQAKPKKNWKLWIGIAASFLLIIGGISLYAGFVNKAFNPYEGSYIIRNGVRITDKDKIQHELNLTIKQAAQKRKEVEELLDRIDTSVRELDELEEQIRIQQVEFLDNFSNEFARNEVKQILEID